MTRSRGIIVSALDPGAGKDQYVRAVGTSTNAAIFDHFGHGVRGVLEGVGSLASNQSHWEKGCVPRAFGILKSITYGLARFLSRPRNTWRQGRARIIQICWIRYKIDSVSLRIVDGRVVSCVLLRCVSP